MQIRPEIEHAPQMLAQQSFDRRPAPLLFDFRTIIRLLQV
jgi:hypothetical protein